jgi:segregation and condensation protein A
MTRRESQRDSERASSAEQDSADSRAAEPRADGEDDEPRADGEDDEPRADDGIPLNIAGHEERDPPEAAGESTVPGDDAADAADGASGDSDAAAGEDGDGREPPVAEDLLDDLGPAGEGEDGVQPVELLVNLAKDGEIDPWDIDIVSVTDKFLDRLDESDLRTSGRALFYASVLLRMKGDELLSTDDDDPGEEPEPWELAPEETAPPQGDPVDRLEAEMDRRLERKRVRGSPETLEGLVQELRDAERRLWWKDAREYDTSESPGGYDRGAQTLDYRTDDGMRAGGEPTEDDVTGTTHEEDIEAVIDDVRAALTDRYERGREEVLYGEVEGAGGSRVMTYLALLFLAHRGEVHLRQDDLFGDLWVRDTGAGGAEGEALAD